PAHATPTSPTRDVVAYDLERKVARPWLATEFSERHARFSPDARWVAYSSDASGRREVYLRLFDGDAPPVPVSINGGSHPIWRNDGTELFFLSPADDLMVVPLTRSGNSISVGKEQVLFRIPLNDITRETWVPYDVT